MIFHNKSLFSASEINLKSIKNTKLTVSDHSHGWGKKQQNSMISQDFLKNISMKLEKNLKLLYFQTNHLKFYKITLWIQEWILPTKVFSTCCVTRSFFYVFSWFYVKNENLYDFRFFSLRFDSKSFKISQNSQKGHHLRAILGFLQRVNSKKGDLPPNLVVAGGLQPKVVN